MDAHVSAHVWVYVCVCVSQTVRGREGNEMLETHEGNSLLNVVQVVSKLFSG